MLMTMNFIKETGKTINIRA